LFRRVFAILADSVKSQNALAITMAMAQAPAFSWRLEASSAGWLSQQ
jgi:hypothetical protein